MHLVGGFDPFPDQRIADAMQSRHGLLIFGSGCHKAHGGTGSGFADGLSVDEIIFITFNQWPDKLRRNEFDLMP
ncbi:Uncharacterised protein [Yersinia aldovae]|uniref:Uncharacterized protein n=1 Tax=Yersinia aldovae TaxID=29483 RepID=A0A0T9UZ94_YERAL|nr:Uncharacterised protein [Yersinia aldovae]CNL83373.1 Uncharacterised protein [Yersinia aldovae]